MQTKINSQTWNFQNSYIELPARLYMKQLPVSVQNPQMIYFNTGLAKDIGLDDSQIILDPGIGFGKSVIDNDIIINSINKFKVFGFPVMIGVSRKSFLSVDDDSAENRLPASLGVTALAVQNGADIIRTHDVEETYRMLSITGRIHQANLQKSRYLSI